jgi:NADPH:quinone reductase
MAQVIRIYRHGDPSVLQVEELEAAMPAEGEVLIKHDAIGVNFVDTMVRDGRFPVALPAVLGFEGAGVITAVGSGVRRYEVGDRVGYFFAAGAYASERVIEEHAIVKLPDDLSSANAATFLAKGLTAWMGLRALHQLRSGEVVLVQGASGSVGSILSRWAKALGATVIGVAGSREKLANVRAGAHHALYASDAAFLDQVHAIAPGGVDVVFDLVGQATFDLSVSAVRDGGEIITIGAASGQPRIDQALLERRAISVKGGGMPQFVNERTIDEASSELFQAIRSGTFVDLDVVHYKLGDVAAAHLAIEKRYLQGIPVLIPSPPTRR